MPNNKFYAIRYLDRSHPNADGEPGFYFVIYESASGQQYLESATYEGQDEADEIADDLLKELERQARL